jgi:MFS family permease
MDTLGAVLGPAIALLFLYFNPGQYKPLFYIAFIPGVIAISFTFFLKDKKPVPKHSLTKTKFLDFIKFWKQSPAAYRKLLVGLLAFTLINSSDVFLLLRIKEAGFDDTVSIGVYIFYNLVYAVFAYPLGILADRIGLKRIFISGLLLFAIVYMGMALNTNLYLFFVLFLVYGIYAASTEGIAKAWITNITDRKDTATAIGTFTSFQSICTMLASSVTGFVWFRFGMQAAFILSSVATLAIILYLAAVPKPDFK